ncbi:MAG TPA: PAS domain S-box protein [Candidatus Acidoferrales bacterium]
MPTRDPNREPAHPDARPGATLSPSLVDLISKSQLNYRDLIDSLDHAVFTISLHGEIRVANRRLAGILGVAFADLIGHRLDEFLSEPTLQQGAAALSNLAATGQWQGRILVRFKRDQQKRFYDCWLQLVREEGRGESVSGWARDVTSQHQSEIRFTELFESLREGIFFTTPDGTLLDANPALVRMLGYPNREELQRGNFRERYADPAQRDALVRRIMEKGSVQDVDVIFRRNDGTEIHCLASGFAIRDSFGQVIRIQGTLVDITERIEVEERLRQEQEFVRQLVANFPEMIAVLDLQGKFTFVSSRIQELLGRSADEVIGKSLITLAHRDDISRLESSLAQFVKGNLKHEQIEYRTRHADGSWRMVRASVSPLYGANGKISGIVASARDVTGAKEAEKQKLQKEKLAAMGEMMSGVAHELNNPLTAILGVSDLIRDRAADDVTRRQADIVLKQARRAAGIVQNLLAFSRPSALASQKMHPEEILQRVVEQQKESLRQKNVNIEVKTAAGLPFIEADPRLLQQVFVNLITNAEQAITAAKDRGTIRVHLGHADHKVSFTFEDDGVGIPIESLSKIFDPFFTTKRPGGGTGLGLTIALAIAKEHGGTIEVDSLPGEGAKVQVILPALIEADAPLEPPVDLRHAAKTKSLPGSPLLQGHSVYVVDDEESIREIVQEGLTARGMSVEGASSSEEALAHLSNHTYDFIICDFNLPGQNGGQFFEKARALPRTRGTKFIFMTGALLDSETLVRFTENGASMLQKPFHMAALATLLLELIPQPSASST